MGGVFCVIKVVQLMCIWLRFSLIIRDCCYQFVLLIRCAPFVTVVINPQCLTMQIRSTLKCHSL